MKTPTYLARGHPSHDPSSIMGLKEYLPPPQKKYFYFSIYLLVLFMIFVFFCFWYIFQN